MKKLIFMCAVATLLTACGDTGKSNLSGLWYRDSTHAKPQRMFAKISNVDKDGNIFVCDNIAREQDIPSECTVVNGTNLQVVTSNKACKNTGIGTACMEYHTETKMLTIGGGRPYSKAQ